MLTRLRLQNFKSWIDTGDVTLKPITAIFGANSSGKTSLIQSLLLLKQSAESSDRSQPLDFGDHGPYVDMGDFPSVVYNHDTSAEIVVSLDWDHAAPVPRGSRGGDSSKRMGFSTVIGSPNTPHPGGPSYVREMSYRVGERTFGLRQQENSTYSFELFAIGHQFERLDDHYMQIPGPNRFYGFPDEVRRFYLNAGSLPDLELALTKQLNLLQYLGPIRAYADRHYTWSGGQPADVGVNGNRAVQALISSRIESAGVAHGAGPMYNLEATVAAWLKKLGVIYEFRVVQVDAGGQLFQVKVRQRKGGEESLITDVGFGVSQILPVLVLLGYAPKGATIILEQPEIHLHPAVQARLADILIDAQKRRDIQIIIESHSEHLLRRLQRRVAEEKLDSNDVALYFCERGASGSKIKALHLDRYGVIANWPDDFFGDDFGEIVATQEAALTRQVTDAA